jgi:putative Mn2+ efflux pump MntP
MSLIVLLLTAAGLAADAFAVSVSKGLQMRHFRWGPSVAIALTFGAFQAVMPVIGWALGSAFADAIVTFDHWIAFGLLLAIGAKMLWEARASGAQQNAVAALGSVRVVRARELLTLGIATSVDALAVGVSLAFLDVSISQAALVIGVITAVLSLVGVRLGHHAGRHLGAWAELLGGLVLIGIGVKILVEHLTGT